MNTRSPAARLVLVAASMIGLCTTAHAVEPEKQPIFTNTPGGLLCGTSATNQCRVPPGKRLIIEHVSGFVFHPISASVNISVSMAINDPGLGLHGNSFHVFVATKTLTTSLTDVFVFGTPLRMMLHPGATFYFSGVAGVSVSGYLVNFTGQ
jgi:hypothetical protein